ncbi:endonuclease [Bacillus sp. T33-2]|uniref:endonuclease n=1 Tax=Bacillus sp. T33-2 TaxID=2054168 RepID=UPI000C773FCE|nr:endonuclease [Bacillus sp. T33-2]PLR93736.1 endonuclease [Bacillus sp. T33-2]
MKKLLALLAAFALTFAVVGCSADKKEEPAASEEKKEEKTNELTDQVKSKMYNTVRIAAGKVDEVFAKETVSEEDTRPVVNSSFADETSAVEFLSKYFSEDIAQEIYAHYKTDQKTEDGRMIVNEEPYIPATFLEGKQADATVEGDATKGTVKTTDSGTYTVEQKDDNYVVTGIEK